MPCECHYYIRPDTFYFSSFKYPDRIFSRNGEKKIYIYIFISDRMKIVPNLKKTKQTHLNDFVFLRFGTIFIRSKIKKYIYKNWIYIYLLFPTVWKLCRILIKRNKLSTKIYFTMQRKLSVRKSLKSQLWLYLHIYFSSVAASGSMEVHPARAPPNGRRPMICFYLKR